MPTEKYDGHHDYLDPQKYSAQTDVSPAMQRVVEGGRNRFATVLWYLANPDSGGETYFPRAGGLRQPPETATNCAYEDGDAQVGLKVPARRRHATLFYNVRPDAVVDPFSFHAGCPPKGQSAKWACNQWVWNRELDEDWSQSVEKLQHLINAQGYT